VTQAHPNTLGALAALHSLAEAWPWLADMLEPGTPIRTRRVLGPAARAQLIRRAQAERVDLVETQRQGLAPVGATPAPLRVAVLNAQAVAVGAVVDAAWVVSSALRRQPMLAFTIAGSGYQERFRAAVEYLRVTLRLIDPDLAGAIGVELDRADRQARAACGIAPDRRRFGDVACPACGRRSLVIRTLGTDSAAVECDRGDCRCRGVDCLCRQPARSRNCGARHMWDAAEFGQLDRLLTRSAA
jgi:hypothetical protein